MRKILMVCLGNICRSPLAEGILRSKLTENFIVDSAGTANYHVGHRPDKRSVKVANENGIDISNLRGRQFSYKDFSDFDIIYAMDKSNYQNIISLAQTEEDKSKVRLILKELNPKRNNEVPDPYFGDMKGFREVYHLLDEVCTVIAERLLKNE